MCANAWTTGETGPEFWTVGVERRVGLKGGKEGTVDEAEVREVSERTRQPDSRAQEDDAPFAGRPLRGRADAVFVGRRAGRVVVLCCQGRSGRGRASAGRLLLVDDVRTQLLAARARRRAVPARCRRRHASERQEEGGGGIRGKGWRGRRPWSGLAVGGERGRARIPRRGEGSTSRFGRGKQRKARAPASCADGTDDDDPIDPDPVDVQPSQPASPP